MDKPKVLFVDIETFPNVSWTWGKYQQNVLGFQQEGCIATFAAKWLDKPVFAKSLPDYPKYKAGSYDDSRIVKELWQLLDEADVVVAHNGDSFDVRVIRARFMVHRLKPPTPFKTVDTKKVSKRYFRFNSNKLDDLGETLHEGRKIKTNFDLWLGCMSGKQDSWNEMVKYNKQDVVLLEKIYKRFLPYITNHPNVTLYDNEAECPKCGSKKIVYRGYTMSMTRRFRRFMCEDCGGWGREVYGHSGTRNTNHT